MQIFGFKGYGITSDRAQGWERVVQKSVRRYEKKLSVLRKNTSVWVFLQSKAKKSQA